MTIRPNKRRFAIAFYLLSGWAPWGVDLDRIGPTRQPRLIEYQRRWIMCCGHALRPAEVAEWKAAGLAVDGEPTVRGAATLVAGPALEVWVSDAFHDLQVRSWAR